MSDTYVRIVGGPWPERHGLTGTVVEPTPAARERYPFHGLGRDEIVVYIDNDPLLCRQHDHNLGTWFCNQGEVSRTADGRPWTCVLSREDVEIFRVVNA